MVYHKYGYIKSSAIASEKVSFLTKHYEQSRCWCGKILCEPIKWRSFL